MSDNPEALFKRADIDNNRVRETPELTYVVVGVDPAATSRAGSDNTGIIAAGKSKDGHYYVLGDYTCHLTPQGWGEAVITAFHKHEANIIIGETNQGGEMVQHTLKTIDPKIPFKAVHSSRGKSIRAEPVSALFEQNRVHFFGTFPELEDELCEWVPGADSPDRLDACVFALTELDGKNQAVDFRLSSICKTRFRV